MTTAAEWKPETYTTFDLKIDGHVAEIVLNRPELLNRADDPQLKELSGVFRSLATNREIRAVVLASTGKVFSAGGDFELMKKSHEDFIARMDSFARGKELVNSILDLPAPIVVALHADVIGVGSTIVLCCDLVVASKNARISDPHVKIGHVAGDGGCVAWPAAAGILKARRYLLTGDPVPAEDAYTFGLVTDLVEAPEDTLPAARALAQKIAKLAPLAVQGTKRSLSRLMRARVYEVLDYSFEMEGITSQSEDLIEAINAFKEKREPVFKGR
ncbi:enoyl-CoA hydratase/isomerase family protein [Sphingobium sp. V4]|uniref:enoyl-CoA hydratase/isomerase family protein n=1 Tax=Sphingobium sp. V4 TaxID=3038927 RepID=UPI002557E59E|nr:enoyl-CoA hydratase/isomerase family protein [Sphingobium sp. V4]WIW89515.1 enoyl-CoA hydratase/isomerase family protein [Sphingobium sp. V4]